MLTAEADSLETTPLMRPWLYRLADPLVRAALFIYFRKIEIEGQENIPSHGPVILAANHPHSITDAMVLASATRRPVHYIAHSGLFRPALRAFFLRQTGVIPVYRRSDESQGEVDNQTMFAACITTLRRGGCIGIFPEGTSQQERRVQKLRTGTARIALEAEAQYDFQLGVAVVPVGLNFENRRHFRTRVLISLGRPIQARRYQQLYEDDPAEAVRLFTTALAERIRDRVINLEKSELGELVHNIERTYQDELADSDELQGTGKSAFQRRQLVSREIARAVEHFYDTDPELVWRLDQGLRRYRAQLAHWKLSDEMIRREFDPTVRSRLARMLVLGAVLLPVGLYGLLLNYLPYKFTGWVARRISGDPTKTHGFQLMVGAVVFSLYYPTLLYGVHGLLGSQWVRTGAFAASLLPAGLFARYFARWFVRERRMLGFAWFSATQRAALQQLRRWRRDIIGDLDLHLDRYAEMRAQTRDPELDT